MGVVEAFEAPVLFGMAGRDAFGGNAEFDDMPRTRRERALRTGRALPTGAETRA